MSVISNSFFVQVIEDGSSLRGDIRSTQPLSQAYSSGACVPNWDATGETDSEKKAKIEEIQPVVYIVLQNGASWIMPDSDYKWYYDGTLIEWDDAGKSLEHTSGLAAGTFVKVNDFTHDMYAVGQHVPAIRIVKNLASSQNVDIDVIRFDGQKTLATNPVSFSASIDVSITEMMSGGYTGWIYLQSGVTDKDISSKNDTVSLVARLYESSGHEVLAAEGAKYRWSINDTIKKDLGTDNTLTVTESDIYDYGIVKCEFYITKEGEDVLVSTDFLEIDDTQDPQEMYFAYNGANGKAASLRSGESVKFDIWVGDAGNPSKSNVDKNFTNWKVLLVDSQKQTLIQDLSAANYGSLADADDNGYRQMASKDGVATITIPFDLAALTADGQNTSGGIRGYVQASTNA